MDLQPREGELHFVDNFEQALALAESLRSTGLMADIAGI
jgi:hypothetical protein